MSTSIKKRMLLGALLIATWFAGATASFAATTVNLTAQRASASMPDGASIPMWQYCGGTQPAGNTGVVFGGGVCGTWAPGPTIVVPVDDTLTIKLTNNLVVPTSITILGQLGGGLGKPVTEDSPNHSALSSTTWPAQGGATFTPPAQGKRERTFGTETAPAQIGTYVWSHLKPGTYLYETATHPSLQVPMGLYGVLIVTQSPVPATRTAAFAPGTAFAGGVLNGVSVNAVKYDADAAFLISEIDAAQNAAVDAAVMNANFLGETAKWNPTCGAAHTCFPPAVNYAPTYLLLNGQPFDANNPGANAAQPQILDTPSGTLFSTGNMMLRVANAGLRTHVPSLVGLSLKQVAEDGNRAPGALQTVSELLMTAGKTRDVLIQPADNANPNATPAVAASAFQETAYGFFDRALGLSTNERPNGGAQGYLAIVNPATLTPANTLNAWLAGPAGKAAAVAAAANADEFTVPAGLRTYTGNVLANDVGVYSTAVQTPPSIGTVLMSADGTFTYTGDAVFSTNAAVSFTYCGNGAVTGPLCNTVTLTGGTDGTPTVVASNDVYTSRVATVFRAWAGEGVLLNDGDSQGFPLSAAMVGSAAGSCATLNADGSFVATASGTGYRSTSTGRSCTFSYIATDSQKVASATAGVVTVNFPVGSKLNVTVKDALGLQSAALGDYMWLIEEDPTFHITPGVTPPSQSNGDPGLTISNSFHVSHTTIVAAGCTGPLSCGDAQTGGSGVITPTSLPGDVALDANKHYFISVLPGDAGTAFIAANGEDPTLGNCIFSNTSTPSTADPPNCGHSIGGATVAPGQTQVSVLVDPNPLKPAQLSIIAFEDNNPVNGDLDENEAGLGGFNVVIFDAAGRSGDVAGQITYDAFNMPLTNWLLGKPGCPNEENPTVQSDRNLSAPDANGANSLVGSIYTCPDGHRNITAIKPASGRNQPLARFVVTTATAHRFANGTAVDFSGIGNALFNASVTVIDCAERNATTFCIAPPAGAENDAVTVSAGASVRDPATYSLAGHALVKNIMPGRFDVLMHPSAARESAGETWLQVSTLEGTPANDAFSRAGEPAYFQEFGPPGYHAFVGWMNPDRINTINKLLGNGNTVKGRVTNLHMSRPSSIFNYDSVTRDPLKATLCYVGLNTTGGNGATAGFSKCDDNGNFALTNVPYGSHQIVVWDQWLDQIIAYFNVDLPAPAAGTTPVAISKDLGDLPVLSWFTMVQENAFVYADPNCPAAAIAANSAQSGLAAALKACAQTPLAQIPITIRFRDGSISNVLQTDSNGNATFNELFPLFNWYVAEVDQTRYAPATAHVVVDGGGVPDCTHYNGDGTSSAAVSPTCTPGGLAPGAVTSQYPTGESTEHTYTAGELYFGLQGFISQTERIDWGKTVLPAGSNGGISGTIVYASTRGFDDPHLEVQFLWEPLVPRVPVNLYQRTTAADGTTTLKWVATTSSTSWDDVAAGSYGTDDLVHNPLALTKPACPGQLGNDKDPYVSQVLGSDVTRCYDGFHNWNQVQPLTYDGYYQFATIYPSGFDTKGNPIGSPVPMPNGEYVIEIVPPPGYEVVKEEDKNILIGDAWVAPPAQQFAGLGNIFILPDQATISSSYNLNGPGSLQSTLGFVDGSPQLPLCSGSAHRVPDYLSLFPQSGQAAPFAGADRPLCDRKTVQMMDGQNGTANFFVYSNTPRAAKFSGIILDDASAEFNVAAPDFGEKFGVPYVAVSIRDQYGIEIERLYGDQWGGYNGMTPSTWQVNVPNPSGYSPNMLVTCMNDPGPISVNGVMQIDPQYIPTYSNFCYTNPFMPGLTTYLDTPVLPVGAFASNFVSGYNPVDCAYPDATPAVSRVDGDNIGPWLSPTGARALKITALGSVMVPNAAYLGPNATAAPYNQKTIQRTYNFAGGQGKIMLGTTDISARITSWTDGEIDVTVPSTVSTGAYELGIINANGNASVDTVTVTIEAATPTVVVSNSHSVTTGGASHVVQAAIDAAKPGDLIMLDAGVYNELVVMWKPVRLQGVGAASVIINAAKYPTDKLEAWRPTINSLFGVDTISGNASSRPQVDPLPGQEITGGIVFLEPSVLATEEGAGITVLAKNRDGASCNSHPGNSNYYDSTKVTRAGGVQQGTLTTSTRKISDSWFDCGAKSRIDGISVTGGDAGGGIYVNGYAHNLEIANNRVYGNAGAFGGGIRVGVPNLETPDLTTIQAGYNNNVNIHHNSLTQNGLIEASGAVGATPGASGAGAGLALCTGTNNYKANYNFVCGNYSSSDGGGIGHIGYSSNGTIAHNHVLFNQSFFQQAATNGGGIVVEGEAPAAGGLSLGAGSVLVDSNLVQGNFAQGGHGGGIALTQVNGSDRVCNNNNRNCRFLNSVKLTNNEIIDNVAGWSAGGLYLQDSVNVSVTNNTVAMNDSVGISGAVVAGRSFGTPSPAGIAAGATSSALVQLGAPAYSYPQLLNNIVWHNRSFYANLTGSLLPPNNVGFQGTAGPYYSSAQLCSSNDTSNAGKSCVMVNTALSSGTTALATLATGACDPDRETYWDLGLVGDSSAVPGANKLSPSHSVLSSTNGYSGQNNSMGDPLLVKAYCNSSQAISASSDEQGNYVDFRYGPLSQTAPVDYSTTASATKLGALFGDYGLAGTLSSAYNHGNNNGAPPADFFGTARPQANIVDIGAVEYLAAKTAVAAVTGGPLSFGQVAMGSTSQPRTLTLRNTGAGALTGIALNFSSTLFSVSSSTCTASLAANSTCTINVVFKPTAEGTVSGTLSINGSVTVTNSPVNLSGRGLVIASLTPASHAFGTGGNSTQNFVLTNNGNTSLTAIAPSLGTTTDFSIVSNTCGTNLGGGNSCVIRVRFAPQSAGAKSATLTITDSAGTQTSALTGTGR